MAGGGGWILLGLSYGSDIGAARICQLGVGGKARERGRVCVWGGGGPSQGREKIRL